MEGNPQRGSAFGSSVWTRWKNFLSWLGWSTEDMENRQTSSILFIVSPGAPSGVTKEVKIDGEWASSPVVATSASSCSICLTTTVIDFELAIPGRVPMHDSDDLAVQRFLYVFNPDGVNTAKTELKQRLGVSYHCLAVLQAIPQVEAKDSLIRRSAVPTRAAWQAFSSIMFPMRRSENETGIVTTPVGS